MARKTITHKPLSNREYIKVKGKDPMVDLFIFTGVRIAEMKKLIDTFFEKGINDGYVDITTKYSGTQTNRIFLIDPAIDCIKKLEHFKGKTVRTLSTHIRNVSDHLGVYFSSHNLRATTATRLLDIGVDIVTVSSILNHSDISITAQYIHFSEDKKVAALGMLDNYATIKGMTMYELAEENVRKEQRIIRLENQIKLLKGEIWELPETPEIDTEDWDYKKTMSNIVKAYTDDPYEALSRQELIDIIKELEERCN